jgi:hypothetical protein
MFNLNTINYSNKKSSYFVDIPDNSDNEPLSVYQPVHKPQKYKGVVYRHL